jgi:DNA mismatch endonuclease (patch repair protein)
MADHQDRLSPGRKKLPDVLTDARTSERMAGIRQRGTKAELYVRRVLHAMGFRFRIRNRDLPGSPDVANRRRRWAVFVHGCFWHRHPGCARTTSPKRNRAFWEEKFRANVERDAKAIAELVSRGYHAIVVWECETEDLDQLRTILRRRLGDAAKRGHG